MYLASIVELVLGSLCPVLGRKARFCFSPPLRKGELLVVNVTQIKILIYLFGNNLHSLKITIGNITLQWIKAFYSYWAIFLLYYIFIKFIKSHVYILTVLYSPRCKDWIEDVHPYSPHTRSREPFGPPALSLAVTRLLISPL